MSVEQNSCVGFNTNSEPRHRVVKYSAALFECSTLILFAQLTIRIETVRAGSPRQCRLERCKKVEQDPGYDDHVIDGDQRYYDQRTVAKTCTESNNTYANVLLVTVPVDGSNRWLLIFEIDTCSYMLCSNKDTSTCAANNTFTITQHSIYGMNCECVCVTYVCGAMSSADRITGR